MSATKNYKQLWMVRDFPGQGERKSAWTKIGVAFQNRDGSFALKFDAMPINGEVQMRDPKPVEAAA